MKKNNKLIIYSVTIVFLVFIMLLFSYNTVFGVGSSDIKSTFNGDTSFQPKAQGIANNIIFSILDVTRTIGAAVAIIILMIIGSKYMLASAGDRADIKKYAINYIIGAVILFAAAGILTIIRDFILSSM